MPDGQPGQVRGGGAGRGRHLPAAADRADYREKIWDHAGGALIVEEAGGTVTDVWAAPEFTHGRELVANRGVIVTNGRLHESVLAALRALGMAGG